MARLTSQQDGYGHALEDHYLGRGGYEINERDDGYLAPSGGPAAYFTEYRDWPDHAKKAADLAKGRVLDVGCGAGRIALYYQKKGLDVLGIDNSPLAVRVCRLRGLKKARVMSITEVSGKLGAVDTIVMFGNNFGLFGSFRRAQWLLRRFHNMTTDDALILAESTDPYQTTEPHHRAYHRWNKNRGRMGGQVASGRATRRSLRRGSTTCSYRSRR
jgi:cyclopropane fatty-acyl-phospholipid synthase-like methyltransferase